MNVVGSLFIAVAVATFQSISGKTLNLTECNGNNTNPLMTLNSYSFNPYPINVPGPLTVSLSVTLNKPIPDNGLSLKVLIQRDFIAYITIPCTDNIGSCTYDVCSMLDTFKNTSCPQQLIDNNIPCTCDTVTPGTYQLINQTFNVPDLTTMTSWSTLVLGTYRVHFEIINKDTNETDYCLTGILTLKDPNSCSGFLCSLFGRRSLGEFASQFWQWLFSN